MAALVLTGRPWAAAMIASQQSAILADRMRQLGLPRAWGIRWCAEATYAALLSVTRYATTFALPVALPVALTHACRTRRLTALALLVLPALDEWRRREASLDPFRWIVLALADDAAYGAGVWWGCIRTGSFRALSPTIRPQSRPVPRRARQAVRPASVGST
jgi:mycofactocin glycosyltransferase